MSKVSKTSGKNLVFLVSESSSQTPEGMDVMSACLWNPRLHHTWRVGVISSDPWMMCLCGSGQAEPEMPVQGVQHPGPAGLGSVIFLTRQGSTTLVNSSQTPGAGSWLVPRDVQGRLGQANREEES